MVGNTSEPSPEAGVNAPRFRPPAYLASKSRQARSCSGVIFAISSIVKFSRRAAAALPERAAWVNNILPANRLSEPAALLRHSWFAGHTIEDEKHPPSWTW